MSIQDKRAEIAFSEINFLKVERYGTLEEKAQRMVHLRLAGLGNMHGQPQSLIVAQEKMPQRWRAWITLALAQIYHSKLWRRQR